MKYILLLIVLLGMIVMQNSYAEESDIFLQPESHIIFDKEINPDLEFIKELFFDSDNILHGISSLGENHFTFDNHGNTLTKPNWEQFGIDGVTSDGDGGLYMTNNAQTKLTIKHFDKTGVELNTIEIVTNGSTSKKFGLAVDSNENLYVANSFSGKIHVYDKDGQPLYNFDVKSVTPVMFPTLMGTLAIYNDQLYVPVLNDNLVQVLDLDGTLQRSFELSDSDSSGYIAMDSIGNIYLPTVRGDHIEIFDNQGNLINKITIYNESSNNQFTFPSIAVDNSGVIYSVTRYIGIIHVIDPGNCVSLGVSCIANDVSQLEPTILDSNLQVTNPRIVDSFGETIFESTVNHSVHVKADIFNDGGKSQSFAYVIKGESDDITLDNNWVHVYLESQSIFHPSVPMIPSTVEKYTFTIEIWNDLQQQSLLIEPIELPLNVVNESEIAITESHIEPESKPTLDFVDSTKDPQSYIDRYNNEESYKEWFDSNYPDYTIDEAVGYEKITSKVPSWVKNNAEWWVDGTLEDSDFASGIQHLVKEKIIDVSVNVESKPTLDFVDATKDPQSYIDRYNNEESYKEWFDSNYPDYTINEATGLVSNEIPSWVKNNAGWWAEGLLSEDDFLKSIEYLVEKQIIRIN